MTEKRIIRFDWAIKTILRDRANFDILEGFLTALLREDIRVVSLLESESNSREEQQKFNRVDLLVKDSQDRHLIIEIQNQQEADYLERLIYGTSKIIVENLNLGEAYGQIKKVISISILYFNLGMGEDYVYHGITEFRGIHTNDLLKIREKVTGPDITYLQAKKNPFPEYYLIRVESFQDLIKADLDEWIYMLKHESVRTEFKSKNIHEAGKKLDILKMKPEERKQYESYLMHSAWERGIVTTAKEEGLAKGFAKGRKEGLAKGLAKGRQEGREEGREEGIRAMARGMKEQGIGTGKICEITGLSADEIEKL